MVDALKLESGSFWVIAGALEQPENLNTIIYKSLVGYGFEIFLLHHLIPFPPPLSPKRGYEILKAVLIEVLSTVK